MGKSRELEVKILNIDKNKIEKKLIKIGASFLRKEYQTNILLDTKDNVIQEKNNSYLRIREIKDLINGNMNCMFTLKQNISRNGIRNNIEIETKIDNKESLIYILNKLEVEVINKGYKERISYIYKDIRFDIDTWDKDTYPYPYMEIEVKKEEDLKKIVALLNIDEKDISTKSIVELRKGLGLIS